MAKWLQMPFHQLKNDKTTAGENDQCTTMITVQLHPYIPVTFQYFN